MTERNKKPITKDKELTPDWYIAKRVLRAHGITYTQMAKMLGTSVTAVHDMCNYTPNVLRIKQMADATGIPFFEFFDFSHEGSVCVDGIDTPNEQELSPAVEKSSALLSCPNCGTVLTASLTLFKK